jgi:drug/metabolite transporter (DMT)-like permease
MKKYRGLLLGLFGVFANSVFLILSALNAYYPVTFSGSVLLGLIFYVLTLIFVSFALFDMDDDITYNDFNPNFYFTNVLGYISFFAAIAAHLLIFNYP